MMENLKQRQYERLECNVKIYNRLNKQTIGTISSIGFGGAFIQCLSNRYHIGAVLPVSFGLDDRNTVKADVEVLYHHENGVGVRYLSMAAKESRRLRRLMTDVLAIVGHRDSAMRLHEMENTEQSAIDDLEQIRKILLSAQSTAKIVLLPLGKSLRIDAKFTTVSEDKIVLKLSSSVSFENHERTIAMFTFEYVSYSFQSKIIDCSADTVFLSFPERMFYSERRSQLRIESEQQDYVKIPLPWRDNEIGTWDILDKTNTGVSIRATEQDIFFWPGVSLPSVKMVVDGKEHELEHCQVIHITSMNDDFGRIFIKVGLQYGFARQQALENTESLQSASMASNSLLMRIYSYIEKVFFSSHYMWLRAKKYFHRNTKESEFEVIHCESKAGKNIVGLLQFALPQAEKTQVPLVIVTPGFGGRKETLSALAATIIHNFRKNNEDIAIFRFDGTNNLGESEKDLGCEKEGMHTYNFTIQDGIDDLKGVIDWAQNNKHFMPTQILVISVSFSSIATRRFLAEDNSFNVKDWIVFMGAADASNAIMNVAGNVDAYGNLLRGIQTGPISLLGCLTNADNFCKDMQRLQIATLEDARADMAKIRANVTWVVGKHDGFMDRQKTRDIMNIQAPGNRNVIEVDAGHVPKSSDEALQQFLLISKYVWKSVHKTDLLPSLPSKGWLANLAKEEWERVRSQKPLAAQEYWKKYLLHDEESLGFDVLAFTPEYQELVAKQVSLADPIGKKVLDVGAGTGNITLALAKEKPEILAAVDLVQEALERLTGKVKDIMPVEIHQVNLEGNIISLMTRFISGHSPNLDEFLPRLPMGHRSALIELRSRYNSKWHAYLKGYDVNVDKIAEETRLNKRWLPFLLDLHLCAKYVRGKIDIESLHKQISREFKQENITSNKIIPHQDNSFDVVTCSLVLSYLKSPQDALVEMYRICKPGGRIVLSSMLPDADTSKCFVNAIQILESSTDEMVAALGVSRDMLMKSARKNLDEASGLMRLEEEGVFHFWDGPTLSDFLIEVGFENVTWHTSFGTPPQAVIATGYKS